jgi:hypothetical protein
MSFKVSQFSQVGSTQKSNVPSEHGSLNRSSTVEPLPIPSRRQTDANNLDFEYSV